MSSPLLFDDGSIRGMQTQAVAVSFATLAFIFVALRMYTRGVIVRNMGAEDYTIVAAWVCSVMLAVFECLEVKHGNGHHIQNVKPLEIANVFKYLYGSLIPYQLGLVLTKVSILWQYHRIFPSRAMRMLIYAMLGVCFLYGCWSVFDNVFMCSPIEFFWNKTLDGKCLSQKAIWFSNASINIASDIIIFLMPLPALRKLQLPTKQKLGLMFIFALGSLVCVVSILRLPQLNALLVSPDPIYDNAPIAYWSAIELNVAIICACLPSLKAFAAKYFPKIMGASRGTADYSEKKSTNANGAMTNRTKNATFTEVEHFDKAFDHNADAGRIQVVTVVEQGREEISNESSPEMGKHGRPLSKGPDMV